MPHNRFFTEQTLFPDTKIRLSFDEAHHVRDVMRVQPNESVELVNGQGQIAEATLFACSKKEVELKIISVKESAKKPSKLFLGLPLLRPAPFDWTIEKATELGVDEIILYPAAQSEKKEISDNMLHRTEKLILSATKQSGRLFTPMTRAVLSLEEIVSTFPGTILWADKTDKSIPMLERIAEIDIETPLLLLAGPEKGWSKEEKQLLQSKAPPVLLAHTILRAETAALTMVALALGSRLRKETTSN